MTMGNQEKITFLIDAEDRATATVRKFKEEIIAEGQAVKELGAKAKSTTDFVNQLAVTFGGSDLGGYAQQIGVLVEKFQQYSSLAKQAGRAGAAGLFVTATVRAINWAAGLDEANQSLERSLELTEKLNQRQQDLTFRRAASDQFSLGLLPDEAKLGRVNRLVSAAQTELDGLLVQQKLAKQSADEANNSYSAWANTLTLGVFGSFGEANKVAQAQVEQTNSRLETQRDLLMDLQVQARQMKQAQEQNAKIQKQKSSRAFIDQLSREVDLLDQKNSMTQEQIDKANLLKNTVGKDREDGAFFQKRLRDFKKMEEERTAARIKSEQAKAKAKANADRIRAREEANAKRIADLEKSSLENIKLRVTAMREGEEAAASLRLQMQGLSKGEADQIAALNAAIDKSAAAKNRKEKIDTPQLTATDQRLLSGRGAARRNEQAEQTKKLIQQSEKQQETLDQIASSLEAIAKKEGVVFGVVGD